jgi:Domain of unknown function (DUF1992)
VSTQSSAEDKREQRLKLLDDHIGSALEISQRNGELSSAPSWGKPLQFGDGYDETPAELRMGYKILKDAGVLPPEVDLMRRIEAQRQAVAAAADENTAAPLRQQLANMQQQLSWLLERLRHSGRL